MKDRHFCPHCGTELAKKMEDGRERLCCPAPDCGAVYWDNPVPVVAGIIEIDGQVLLARNSAWSTKMFGLITGFLEKGETPEAGIKREVREELGLDSEIVDLVGLYSFFEKNQLIIAYHLSADGEIRLGEEIAEIKMVPIDKLKPWGFGTGPAVADWLKKRQQTQTA